MTGNRMQARLMIAAAALVSLNACATRGEPAVEVRTVEVLVEVQKPCPGEKPERPAPLERPLPGDLEALAAVLAAKLAEWSAPGMYGDKAEALLERCLAPG